MTRFRVELEAIDTIEVEANSQEEAEDKAVTEAQQFKAHWYTISIKELTHVGG